MDDYHRAFRFFIWFILILSLLQVIGVLLYGWKKKGREDE